MSVQHLVQTIKNEIAKDLLHFLSTNKEGVDIKLRLEQWRKEAPSLSTETEELSSVSPQTCVYIFKRGQHSNMRCQARPKDNCTLCSKHSKVTDKKNKKEIEVQLSLDIDNLSEEDVCSNEEDDQVKESLKKNDIIGEEIDEEDDDPISESGWDDADDDEPSDNEEYI